MSIRSFKSFVAGLWDWGMLRGCFGDTKIKVGDIDGGVERNGYVLLFEGKSTGKSVPDPQIKLYDALIKIGRGRIMVVTLWGVPPRDVKKIRIQGYSGEKMIEPATTDRLRSFVSWWFDCSNKRHFDWPREEA